MLIKRTKLGKIVHADSLKYLDKIKENSVDLIITSPPFALTRKKLMEINKDRNILIGLKFLG